MTTLLLSTHLFSYAITWTMLVFCIICFQAGFGSMEAMGEEVTCNAESSIVIEQRDLQFDHPATSLTAVVECSCFATHIRLACGSEWIQAYADAAHLTVIGDGVCLLLPNQVMVPYTPLTFLYQHSPPLVDIHAIDATFFNCTPT
eukprot:c37292_g1_i1 orf=1-432(-)